MKTSLSCVLALALATLPLIAADRPTPPLDKLLTDSAFFTKPMNEIMPPEGGFQWLSEKHDGMRAEAQRWQLFGEKTGEIVIRGDASHVLNVSISLYNKGDDGEIPAKELDSRFDAWKKRLSENLGLPGESYTQNSAVTTKGWIWKKDKSAWLMESSVSRGSGAPQAEFLRLRLASLDAAGAKSQVAHRASLPEHIVKKDNGDVYIDGVPMVDQGQKGYCAVATAERVARYYGLEVDQHEMAQVAKTDGAGTSMAAMEEALKRITGRLHISTTKRFEYDANQYNEDLREYNMAAKHGGAEKIDGNQGYVDVTRLHELAKPDIFLAVKSKQTAYKSRFIARIEEAIDKGVPVCWSLELGMFPEQGLPQSHGGHMRLIIGYNKKTDEIIYTDSWGAGHEFKRMPGPQAWCMTTALYTMAPTS